VIAFDGLRVDGLLLVDGDGAVTRADPIVLLPLDVVLDLAGRGLLVTGDRGTYRVADQVGYQPVAWTSGCLVFQRVENDWPPLPPAATAAAAAVTAGLVPLPPGPCPHPPHLPCPACNMRRP
jgi:hypothetical protein